MDRIKKLPFIMAAFITLIIGIVSEFTNIKNEDIYVRMITSMIVFYILGLYLRSVLIKVFEEVEDETLTEDKIEQSDENNEEDMEKGKNFDVKTDDDELFSEDISKIISNKIDE